MRRTITALAILTKLNDVCLQGFSLRPSAYLSVLCVKEAFRRRDRRDTQRAAEKRLQIVGTNQVVGAVEGEHFVGGFVDFGYGDFRDYSAANPAVMLPDGRVGVKVGAVHDNDYGRADRRRDMNGTRVVRNKDGQPRLGRSELWDGQTVKEDRSGRKARSHVWHHAPLLRTGEHDLSLIHI